MGWIKDRIDAEYRKHKDLDWSLLAEKKILATLKHSDHIILCDDYSAKSRTTEGIKKTN